MIRVAAVIPNWNGAQWLRRLFPTLKAQTERFDTVIVVDNGSTDDSLSVCREFGADVICLDRNRGFAAAVNLGVHTTQAEFVAILNNDVELRPDWLKVAMRALEDPTAAYAVGKLLSAGDSTRIDGSFDALAAGGCALRCGSGRKDTDYWNVPRRIQFPPFTAIVVRAATYREVGGLDESFESYLEDVEFGLRCASKGYTGHYEPAAVALHSGSSTFGQWNPRTVRFISRNQLLLIARHYDWRCLIRFGWSIAVAQLLWGLVAVRRGAARAWVSGKLEGIRLFASCRRSGDPHTYEILRASERLIWEVQTKTGFDLYWRIYLALALPRLNK